MYFILPVTSINIVSVEMFENSFYTIHHYIYNLNRLYYLLGVNLCLIISYASKINRIC